jgi:hypothetical protein
MSLAGSLFLICAIPYLFLAYTFFLIPYVFYLLGKHTREEKVMQTFSLILAPLMIPFGIILWIGWGIMSILGGILVVILFSMTSWFAWLYSRFPFGKVFKAWFAAAYWVLKKVRELLERLGVKKLFFGIPLSRFEPLQPV